MVGNTLPQELVIGNVSARAETHGEWVFVGEPGVPGGGGEYLHLCLNRVLTDVTLKDHDGTRTFTLLETVWQNLWDYRLNIGLAKVALLDSDGFQHRECGYEIGSEVEVLDPGTGRFCVVRLHSRESTLEGRARVQMRLWFSSPIKGALPARLVVEQLIFSPGATSGPAVLSETVELSFTDVRLAPATTVL